MCAFMIFCIIGFAAAASHSHSYSIKQQHRQYSPAAAISTTAFEKDIQGTNKFALKQHQQIPAFHSPNSVNQYTPSHWPVAPAAHLLPPTQAAEPFESTHHHSHHHENQQIETEYLLTKRFYMHSAPEEEEEETLQRSITIGKPRKNVNVVFIRALSKAAQRTSLKIVPTINEEKTVIYVLAKKMDASDIDAQVLEPSATTSKPEVFFIMYKTTEEAAHAQQRIQAEYDSLGGSTLITDEGVSQVTSVIGSLDADKQDANAAELAQEEEETEGSSALSVQNTNAVVGQLQTAQTSGSGYLPPLY